MKFIYTLLLKRFVMIFPERNDPVRVILKSFITNLLLFKRKSIAPFKSLKKQIKKLLHPIKQRYIEYKIRTDPRWGKRYTHTLWSAVWKENAVYKKDLFFKWSESVGQFLNRTHSQVPFQNSSLPKLCLVGRPGSTHFVEPVIKSLSKDFEIYYQPFFSDEFLTDAENYDVIWFEWGTSGWPMTQLRLLKESGGLLKTKLIIRVHDFELNRPDVMNFTDWELADKIVFINRSALQDFSDKHPTISKHSLVFIPNIVNENSFSLKDSSSEHRILINCIKLSERKGLNNALTLFEKVFQRDPRYRLTIRTTSISDRASLNKLRKDIYKLKLPEGVVNLRVDNEEEIAGVSQSTIAFDIATNYSISKMYHEFDILWSTSSREGFHYAIAEGMLSGLFPVVRNWEWGQPNDFWEGYVAESDQDFIEKTLGFSQQNECEKRELSKNYRSYVIEKFGLDVSRKRLFSDLFKESIDVSVTRTRSTKRVIFFAHNHLYAENPRGGEHSSAEVLRGLRSQGYECLVVVQNRKSKRLERCTYDNGMPVISLPGEVFRLGIKEIMLWWQPDVAMVWEIPTLDIWDVCKSRGIPYIVFVRFWHIVAPPPYINLLEQEQDPAFLVLRKPVFQNAHTIISNSKNTAEVIDHLYQKESTISYVPVQKLESLKQDAKYITLINPGKTMGAEDLIYKIAAAMPDFQFKIFQGDERHADSNNIVYAPYCDQGYNYMFADTKLFIFPFEGHPCGTGRVVFECYYLGIPVIGSRSAGLPEIIPEEHLVDSTADLESWISRIRLALVDYPASQKKIAGIADKFTAESQLKIVYDAVESACAYNT
ncbi:MAG: glycosyltransferase involved in cell wall biosynthesis [Arenicella sp.]|jgi:glycosyltransferase involved in cell wall biosynthesis